MGSYAYCSHKGCEWGLSKPTLHEMRYGGWVCPAGHDNEFRGDITDLLCDLVEDLQERVEALEKKETPSG